jgi:putative transposase
VHFSQIDSFAGAGNPCHQQILCYRERVRRLMRENGLQAAPRMGSPRGPRNHDGTIIPETIDTMWGTDMTAAVTVEHGQVAVFVAVDHCSAECVGIHAALNGTRHEALEPVRQGAAERFGGVEKDAAAGLGIRHDHGSQYMPALGQDLPDRRGAPPGPDRLQADLQ